MRTTIEIDDDVRAELLKSAAQAGAKGYSGIINEILKRHFGIRERLDREERARRLEALAGSISDETAERMHRTVRELREDWRTDS
jgi:Arc/MetJ family transcription regulator